MNEPAVSMDERLTAYLASALEAAGYPPKEMPSGAGHDAMVMATRMPAAMLFLRSPGGISHHPDETVLEEDVEVALHVGRKFLQRLASDSNT
jgi:allantoate deiminase